MKLQELIESFHFTNKESELDKIVPLTISSLSKDMMLKAKFYKGDLLMTVLSVSKEFWQQNKSSYESLIYILGTQSDKVSTTEASFEMKGDWYEKIDLFRKIDMD